MLQHRLATPVIQPRMHFFDREGKPLIGGRVYSFKVGEPVFKPTYRNSEFTAANQNPIVLDSAGSALIYLRGSNQLRIYDKNGNHIENRIEYQQLERAQFYDDYGKPLKNGFVYTYDYQSTIKKTSYSIDDLANPNPIALDESGTALVNIVGAYRLRQYNSKNVFVGDQDFKRPPVKVLTSVVYPLFHHENMSTSFALNDGVLKEPITSETENISTTFAIDSVSFRVLKNEIEAEIESIRTGFSLDVVTFRIPRNEIKVEVESLKTDFSLEAVQITRAVNYLNTVMDIESIQTSFALESVQITNQV